MKNLLPNHPAITVTGPYRGFTLVELLMAVGVMMFVIAGLMSANFLGLREDQLMESKAGANDTSRLLVNQMLYNIRSAKGYAIGNMSGGTNFIAITNGTYQGSALKLYVVSMGTNQIIDPSQYILYYYDTSQLANLDAVLWTLNSTNGQAASVVASNLVSATSNTLSFTSENYFGTPQTVRTEKGIIHTTLQFSQFLYPLTPVGSNCLFSSYSIDCRATPHIPDGQ